MSAQSAYQEFLAKYQGSSDFENMTFSDYFSSEIKETKEFISSGVEDSPSELMETEFKKDIFNKIKPSSLLRSLRINKNSRNRNIQATTVGNKNLLLHCPITDRSNLGIQGKTKKISSLRSLRIGFTSWSKELQETIGNKSSSPMLHSVSNDHSSKSKRSSSPTQSKIVTYFKPKPSGQSSPVQSLQSKPNRRSLRLKRLT